ncbi:hypothetical protein N44_00892 [Microcystis aeruginosa NIES-44]|uniref:Uncharacterized protein n=1 Tax=Microcystis aeruginosa NIES-44 TaxID=449439 RepID=A0A0A1VRV5_MICAE|nr:hypothetical protein N44_00892 [Microcystis aeruginosa NIES-44]
MTHEFRGIFDRLVILYANDQQWQRCLIFRTATPQGFGIGV